MRKGFTLIEILVSVAIFTVVVVIALGALLAMSTADRKAETIKSVVDNLDFAVDSMSRSLRTGYGWGCDTTNAPGVDCVLPGGNEIIFTPGGAPTTDVEYQLDLSDTNCGSGYISCIETRTFSGTTWSNWAPITSPDVVLTMQSGSLFHVVGTGSGDKVQPKAVITLTGYVQVTPTEQSQFSMQTAITQRLYDQ